MKDIVWLKDDFKYSGVEIGMLWCSLSPLFYCVYEDFLTEEVTSNGK